MSENEKSISIIENITFNNTTETSDDNLSSDGLEIDISESPERKKVINIEDKRVLENIEEEIERQYEEKAAKSNLTVINVKNILKHVITNEHVWAMVRNTTDENCLQADDAIYEPKLTRAKAKELLKNQNVSAAAIPWANSAPKSEVHHILIHEELKEDSDDDEYVPHEEESEDEKENCNPSDTDSQPATPATPTSTHDNSTQTIWTDDGIFKIPPSPASTSKTNENIALRTRSKLSLSDTPLETIEEAFIPPDITTDMYDLECDDEDWKDFLKKFTRPLEEAVTGIPDDDDEADPEYNVLSDEEIDKIDREELRQDRGVKITKKELNTLVSELIEFSEMFSFEKDQQNNDQHISSGEGMYVPPSENCPELVIENFSQQPEGTFSQPTEICQTKNYNDQQTSPIIQEPVAIEEPQPEVLTNVQMLLFEQQMRQHVQMLTQNFILSFKHIYFGDLAIKFKNMLLSLEEISKYKTTTAFKPKNLSVCLNFLRDWEAMIEENGKEVQEMINYTTLVAQQYKQFAEKQYEYIVTFPPFLMKKVTESPAFMYPSLLPRIPYRYTSKHHLRYEKSESELIAIGLEQFVPYIKENSLFQSKKDSFFRAACSISKYMMPHRDPSSIVRHIKKKRMESTPNPIKYYIENHKAPTAVHYVCNLEEFGMLPPNKRPPDSLPYQWKNFLYPEPKPETIPKPKKVTKPPAYKKRSKKVKLCLPKAVQQSTPVPITTTAFSNQPVFVINNVVPFQQTVDFAKPSFLIIQHNNIPPISNEILKPVVEETSNQNRIILPKFEEVYLSAPSKDNYIPENSKGEKTNEKIKHNKEILNFKFNSKIFKKIKDNMLPSMPFLSTPVKEQRDINLIDQEPEIEIQPVLEPELIFELEAPKEKLLKNTKTNEEHEKINEEHEKINEQHEKINEENEKVVETSVSEKESKKDDENELNALMVASSTMQQKIRRMQPNLTKKAKQMREYNATLAMLCPEDKHVTEEKAKNFAQAYYDKIQERLESDSPLEYQKFMATLSEHDDTNSSVTELYEKVSSLLSPKYPDLCEEFLTFLTPEQAQQIGKLFPHFMLTNMSLFLRKLEIYYSNQPAQLRKIYNSLIDLAETVNITMNKVKSTILPLLKGNTLLIDWFLQMFPEEPPSESAMTTWEQINCDDDDVDDGDEVFETLTVPEVEDPYGGPNCICKCHKIEDEMYKKRTRHCIPCGTKFLQGRVYVQTGKGLRLANVTFNNNPNADQIKRLSVKPIIRQKRKSETSPLKVRMSPTKDDEPRQSNESEEDITDNKKSKNLKSLRTYSPPKTRKKPVVKTQKIMKKETISKIKPKSENSTGKKSSKSTKNQKKSEVEQQMKKTGEINKSGISENEKPNESETEEMEIDTVDINKSEIPENEKPNESETEEMEMDTCEESSQDTLDAQVSESDDSLIEEMESESEDSNSPAEDSPSWTREEDKILLQTFQKNGDSENVFKNIRKLLPGRKEVEIAKRFHNLMSFLQEMTNDT